MGYSKEAEIGEGYVSDSLSGGDQDHQINNLTIN